MKSVIHCILRKLLMRKINRLMHAVYGAKIIAAKIYARQFFFKWGRSPRVPNMAGVCLCLCLHERNSLKDDKLFNI